MIYFHCSPLGPLISWLNYSLKLSCVVLEVQVHWDNSDCCFSKGIRFLFEIIYQDTKVTVLWKQPDRQQPPAVHTTQHMAALVHMYTLTCVPSRKLLWKVQENFKDLSILSWHICVRALMTDRESIHHNHSPPAATPNVPTSHLCMLLPYPRKKLRDDEIWAGNEKEWWKERRLIE